MKYLIAVPVWNKEGMIEWMLRGLAENINPEEAEILFYFDACRDQSEENFKNLAPDILSEFKYSHFSGTSPQEERGCHYLLIDRFMKTDCDVMLVTQDDNRLQSQTILQDLTKLITSLGDQVGFIGGRDGYNAGYQDMISSPFSASVLARSKLPIGGYALRDSVNPGPLVYCRSLVEILGNHNPVFKTWYWWDDYSLRAKAVGLQNAVLGMDILHMKFGSFAESETNKDLNGWAAKDLATLRSRHRNFL